MAVPQDLEAAVATLRGGGVIAYPTEAVWGLGCDPDNAAALTRLLSLKRRDPAKGVILIAGTLAQLEPWLEGLDDAARRRLAASWPGPVTWLVPDNSRAHALVRGEHTSVALRVSDHPLVESLCAAFGGPIVSTSANRGGESPARDSDAVRACFGDAVQIVEGALGGRTRPSAIRDLLSDAVLRH